MLKVSLPWLGDLGDIRSLSCLMGATVWLWLMDMVLRGCQAWPPDKHTFPFSIRRLQGRVKWRISFCKSLGSWLIQSRYSCGDLWMMSLGGQAAWGSTPLAIRLSRLETLLTGLEGKRRQVENGLAHQPAPSEENEDQGPGIVQEACCHDPGSPQLRGPIL